MVRLASATVFSACAIVAHGITKEKLGEWAFSSKGLDQSRDVATKWANQEYSRLSMGRSSLQELQELKDTLYSSSYCDFKKVALVDAITPLAENRVSAKDLQTIWSAVYSTSGADMQKQLAQETAVLLAQRRVAVQDLKALWSTLYSISGMNLNKNEAQHWLTQLALAGSDPVKLADSFKTYYRTMSKDKAAQAAIEDSIIQSLGGLPQRFAKDGVAYTAKDFQGHYREAWVSEWNQAPEQLRVAQDGGLYSAAEFKAYYGDSWASRWGSSPVAAEKRLAADNKGYTVQEFVAHYRDTWQTEWFKAAKIADDCAFLNHDACDAAGAKCTWKWTGDWTDSCVLKPATSEVVV